MGDKQHMEDSADWKFKRGRNGDEHITNCASGYRGIAFEIHHILCVHACSDATFPDGTSDTVVKFIYECLKITDWNINAAPNNIGLPKKWSYILDGTGAWDGLPCHQVDHDRYLETVATYVRDKIWSAILTAQEEEDCEALTGKAIAGLFNAGSARWKGELVARGVKFGGTKACLDYCINGTAGAMDESNWHVPFSMAMPEGNARKRVKPRALVRLGLLALIK